MALINCPECEKQISDKANSCPDCGFPINNDNKFKPREVKVMGNIQKHNNIEIEAKRLVENGQLLAAVKYYKDNSNCSLKEAKDKVDLLRGVTPSHNNSGCGAFVLVFVLISGISLFFF